MTISERVAQRYANDSEDRSTHPTVVEYAVQTMFKGKSPAAAAKDTAKKHSGSENMFFGPGISIIDPKTLEEALWGRMVENVVKNVARFKEGMEHITLDATLGHFHQKPNLRAELKKRAIKSMGHDPFVNDGKG